MTGSKIEWTEFTWNPIVGCSVESAGCTNCYAMKSVPRLVAMGVKKYEGLTKETNGGTVWNGKIHVDDKAMEAPFKWRKPRMVFVNSMGDMFHPKVSLSDIERVWMVMRNTPQHTYQILTKHPKRMSEMLSDVLQAPPLPNVWLGTSVESAKVAKVRERIAHLRRTPAQVRFVSFEPLIGSVASGFDWHGIDWAVVGGESGSGARPMNPQWVHEILAKCQEHDIDFFFKQWGSFGEDGVKRSKQKNGRIFNGRLWDNFPKNAIYHRPATGKNKQRKLVLT